MAKADKFSNIASLPGVRKFKEEKDAMKVSKEKKKSEMTGLPWYKKLVKSIPGFLKMLVITMLTIVFTYAFVLVCARMIPQFVAVLLVSLGFTLEDGPNMFMSACVGLFIVAWMFTFSYKVVSVAWKRWSASMRDIFKKPEEETEETSKTKKS